MLVTVGGCDRVGFLKSPVLTGQKKKKGFFLCVCVFVLFLGVFFEMYYHILITQKKSCELDSPMKGFFFDRQ